jgi:hypothetical protein
MNATQRGRPVHNEGKDAMRRIIAVASLTTIALGGLVRSAAPGLASWVSSNCYDNNYEDSNVKRSDAQAYGAVAKNEGYEWGGGCWNNNNRDDTPGQPDTSGEGPDCSGFTFKTWEMKNSYGKAGWRYWDKWENEHGPYATSDYHDVGQSSTLPFYRLPNKNRSTTLYMDAFAKNGHVGMLYTSSDPGNGLDYILEALGDAYGTNVNQEDYRSDSAYVAIRRKDWTPDCFPNCSRGPASTVMVR